MRGITLLCLCFATAVALAGCGSSGGPPGQGTAATAGNPGTTPKPVPAPSPAVDPTLVGSNPFASFEKFAEAYFEAVKEAVAEADFNTVAKTEVRNFGTGVTRTYEANSPFKGTALILYTRGRHDMPNSYVSNEDAVVFFAEGQRWVFRTVRSESKFFLDGREVDAEVGTVLIRSPTIEVEVYRRAYENLLQKAG